MARLKLNDGTLLEGSEAGYAEPDVWCFLRDVDFGRAYELFSDPEKTAFIRYQFGSTEIIYEGYTELNAIQKNSSGISVRMRGGTKPPYTNT